jgi:putative transposase
MVTGATYKKNPFLSSSEKKEHFLCVLFERLEIIEWRLDAWAILPNIYHFIAQSSDFTENLSSTMRAIHSINGKYINALDKTPGRRVWYNYWDTCITHEGSYLARLHYVHVNPVKHGIVDCPEDYGFCSYDWFMRNSDSSHRNKVFHQPMELINVKDDF